MKTTMKKTAAYLLAFLLVFQMVPAFAGVVTSNEIQTESDLLEVLRIINESGKTVQVGHTLQLYLPYGYDSAEWFSSNTSIAKVDRETGEVTGIEPGKVKITAKFGDAETSAEITVIAPPAPSASGKESMVIVVKGSKTRLQYDGQPHKIEYEYSSDSGNFDESKIELTKDVPARTIAGAFKGDLKAEDFKYNDDSVEATFIVNDGSVWITPIAATVKADDLTIELSDLDKLDPTATVSGLIGDDELDYTFVIPDITAAGEYEIEPAGDKAQGGYSVTFVPGRLTVTDKTPMRENDLYNIAQIGSDYYRLAKTKIYSNVEIKIENAGAGKLKAEDYQVDNYDFSSLKINIGGVEYLYKCSANAEAIVRGANYYEIKKTEISIVMNKIGALDKTKNNEPRWLVPENQRYPDDNNTSGFHRDFVIALTVNKDKAVDQEAYNFLGVNSSMDYYKLPKTKITAKALDSYKEGRINEGEYILERYDFTNTILPYNDKEYKYIDHVPTGDEEYENYYTVSFEDVQKNAKFNKNEKWYPQDVGWLDGARAQYGDLGNNYVCFHANYRAITYDAKERPRSVTITSDWPEGKIAYSGAKITLTATPVGFGENVRYQWQRSAGNDIWENIPGENGITYTYILDDSTAQYIWRVVAEE